MTIYGTRASHMRTEQLKQEKCPNCEAKGVVCAGIFNNYFHIFRIPFFPLGKSAVAQCQNCKHAMKESEMPFGYGHLIADAKVRVRIPKWHYSGLVIVGLLLLAVTYSGSLTGEMEQRYIREPQAGDVYRYKAASNYSTFMVIDVTKDSVMVYPNQYEATKMAGIYQIDRPENYIDIPMSYSRDELIAMYNEGTIYSIDR